MSPAADGNIAGKRLVVFGCGYVGAAVALQGQQRELHVTALTRNHAKAIALRAEGIETIVADLAGRDWHERIEAPADFVLNCVSSGGGGAEGYQRSYVDGMRSIRAWAERHGRAGTVVYTSSTSVYPQGAGEWVVEASDTGGDERATLLLEAERLLCEKTVACDRWFVLRLAGIYGPGRHHLLNQVRLGEISGHGDYRLNIAHRDDIVGAVWACFFAPTGIGNEVFNIADDQPTAKTEVAAWLAARLGVSMPRFSGEPAVGRRSITPDRVIATDKAKAMLGWQPRYPSFREGYESLLSR